MLQKCIRLDPHNPYSLAQMGKILYDRGKQESAETYLLDAADIFLQRGHKRQAHPLFFQILNFNSGHASAILGLIQSSTTTHELAEAQEILSKALFSNKIKDDHFLRNTLKEAWGFAALQAENFEEAREAFQFLSHKNEDLYAKDMIIFLEKLIEKKKPEFAIPGFKEALPALIRRQLTTTGLRLIQELDAQAPDHPDIKFIYAGLYSAEGDQEKSLNCYRQALDLYLARRMKMEALTTVENLLQLDPLPSEYWNLHEKLFKELYPEKPYEPPRIPSSNRNPEESSPAEMIADEDSITHLTMEETLEVTPSAFLPKEKQAVPIPKLANNLTLNATSEEKESDLSSFLLLEEEELSPPSSTFSDLFPPESASDQSTEFLTAITEEEYDKNNPLSPFTNFLMEQDRQAGSIDDQEFTLEIIDEEEPANATNLLPYDLAVTAASPGNGSSSAGTASSPVSLPMVPTFPESKVFADSVLEENPVEIISEEEISRTVDDFFAGLSNPTPMDLKLIDEFYARGLAYKDIGMLTNATEAFLQAFNLIREDISNPKYFDCCTSLSCCAMSSGDPKQSIYYLQKALHIPGLEKDRILALRRELESAYKAAGIDSSTGSESGWNPSTDTQGKDAEKKSSVGQENHP